MSKPTPKNEPAAYIGLALTVAVTAAGQLLHLSDAQWRPLLDAAPLLAGMLTRFFVSPAAGRDVASIVAQAVQDAADAQARLEQLRTAVAAAMPAASAADVAPAAPVIAAPVPAAPVPAAAVAQVLDVVGADPASTTTSS